MDAYYWHDGTLRGFIILFAVTQYVVQELLLRPECDNRFMGYAWSVALDVSATDPIELAANFRRGMSSHFSILSGGSITVGVE